MKVAVVYASMTGKTKKVAKAMAAALGVKAVPVKEAAQCKEADLLFLGSGIYGGKLSPELLEFAKTLQPDRVKKAALFHLSATEAAAPPDLRDILTQQGIPVEEEEFSCAGSFLFFMRMGHPTKEELAAARDFAVRCAKG